MPTKIAEFSYAKSFDGVFFGAIQVVLSNGMESPVMKAKK
jgi:hypothetical protein